MTAPLCAPGGPRHPDTPGPYCAPGRCYCPGQPQSVPRGPRTTVDGEPIYLPWAPPRVPRGGALDAQVRENDPDEVAAGVAAGQRAGERALGAAGEAWEVQAKRAVWTLAKTGREFTSNDVWDSGLPDPPTGNRRALGPVLMAAARAGIIRKVGSGALSQRGHGSQGNAYWQGVRS